MGKHSRNLCHSIMQKMVRNRLITKLTLLPSHDLGTTKYLFFYQKKPFMIKFYYNELVDQYGSISLENVVTGQTINYHPRMINYVTVSLFRTYLNQLK